MNERQKQIKEYLEQIANSRFSLGEGERILPPDQDVTVVEVASPDTDIAEENEYTPVALLTYDMHANRTTPILGYVNPMLWGQDSQPWIYIYYRAGGRLVASLSLDRLNAGAVLAETPFISAKLRLANVSHGRWEELFTAMLCALLYKIEQKGYAMKPIPLENGFTLTDSDTFEKKFVQRCADYVLAWKADYEREPCGEK